MRNDPNKFKWGFTVLIVTVLSVWNMSLITEGGGKATKLPTPVSQPGCDQRSRDTRLSDLDLTDAVGGSG